MKNITQDYLKECVTYCPSSGEFTWRKRPLNHFKSSQERNRWNTRYAGTKCGCKTYEYLVTRISGKQYYLHKLAFLYMEGSFPAEQGDHINHNRIDNRWVNLRRVSRHENLRNKCLPKNNTSGRIGVSWAKHKEMWHAQMTVNGKNLNLGYTADFSEAVRLRELAELKHDFHPNHGSLLPST